MPIVLNQDTGALAVNSSVANYSPKFFSSTFTGSGKSTGLLCEFANPLYVQPDKQTSHQILTSRKQTFYNGATKTSIVPMNVIPYGSWSSIRLYRIPELAEMTKVATVTHRQKKQDIYAYAELQAIMQSETTAEDKQTGVSHTSRQHEMCYQIFLYAVRDANSRQAVHTNDFGIVGNGSANGFMQAFTSNPNTTLQEMFDEIRARLPSSNILTVDDVGVIDFIRGIDVYQLACRRSEQWHTQVVSELQWLFQSVSSSSHQLPAALRLLEQYAIPLDEYKQLYDEICKTYTADEASSLCKQNLNLLLNSAMTTLDANKGSILTLKVADKAAALAKLSQPRRFSPEQLHAIQSEEPLVLIQSGAGCGKSSVVLGRIDYMCKAGVKPEDITVLSFTNAAADHIRDKNPDVHSMTIASMVHQIYELNYPKHQLSSMDTIVNSIDIFYPPTSSRPAVVDQFRKHCEELTYKGHQNLNMAYTDMNNFLEDHMDEIIQILDTIEQVSLELEIMICYHKIETMKEPPAVASKHLIIDEVQDNSIFEFVYVLKYVTKHLESLYIVGDCSQTLFEFRASNPRALNVMEASGVFQTYKLQVNYRSNQEILDFANVLLQNIEANQFAQLQLKANSLARVTMTSFQDKVKLYYHRVTSARELDQNFDAFIQHAKPFIDAKIQAREQIAFLAYQRRLAVKMENWLKKTYPNEVLVNIVPDRMINDTVFSQFIRKYWRDIQFAPTQYMVAAISREIYNRLPHLMPGKDIQKQKPIVQKMLQEWDDKSRGTIAMWFSEYKKGQITHDEFLKLVRDDMLAFEIDRNAIKQALNSSKNEKMKQQQMAAGARFVISTIHSAKGLEWDNTVVIYQNATRMAEDQKRMYYVALTRAMHSEMILAYDTVKSPSIVKDYETIIANLKAAKVSKSSAAIAAPAAVGTDTPPDAPAEAGEDDA